MKRVLAASLLLALFIPFAGGTNDEPETPGETNVELSQAEKLLWIHVRTQAIRNAAMSSLDGDPSEANFQAIQARLLDVLTETLEGIEGYVARLDTLPGKGPIVCDPGTCPMGPVCVECDPVPPWSFPRPPVNTADR